MTVRWNSAEVEARVRQAAARGVVRGTEDVRNEVLRLIQETPKTGRVYRRRGVEHQASAPGEAPASDTGVLVRNIRPDYARLDELVGVVRSSAKYAAHLEYGTSRMTPRPYMRPALANRSELVQQMIGAEIRAELRRG